MSKRKIRSQESPNITRRTMIVQSASFLAPLALGLPGCARRTPSGFDADVIVIGAGLAGLSAGLILEEFGAKILVLEATDRIGGRVYTADEADVPGHPELGANGIGGGYARLLDAARKYGVEISPMRNRTEPREGELLYQVGGQTILREDWPTHAENPYEEEWARKMSPSGPPWGIYGRLNPLPANDLAAWRRPEFSEWDRSAHSVLSEAGFSERAIALGAGTNSGYGTDEHDISALMYFQILNFISVQTELSKNGEGGAAKGGNQRIPEAMAAAFGGDLRRQTPVSGIATDNGGVDVSLETGEKLRAKFAIVTLPLSALRLVPIDPQPPQLQLDAITNLGYTPNTQIHYVPKRPYWEDDGLPPSMWTETLAGRFMALKNDPDDPDKVTSCVAYVNGEDAKSLAEQGEEAAIAGVTKTLETFRPSLAGALEPVLYWTWTRNRFAGGAYAYWKPGQITSFSNEVATPHGRIHFAGEHTALINRGMEGAMESGERAALEVLDRL